MLADVAASRQRLGGAPLRAGRATKRLNIRASLCRPRRPRAAAWKRLVNRRCQTGGAETDPNLDQIKNASMLDSIGGAIGPPTIATP